MSHLASRALRLTLVACFVAVSSFECPRPIQAQFSCGPEGSGWCYRCRWFQGSGHCVESSQDQGFCYCDEPGQGQGCIWWTACNQIPPGGRSAGGQKAASCTLLELQNRPRLTHDWSGIVVASSSGHTESGNSQLATRGG